MLDLKELLYPLVMGMIWTWNTVASAVLTLIGPRLRRFVRMQMKLGGILINTKENKPGDIRVLNEDFYHRLGIDQLLGLGEMYMEGWWECDHLDVMFTRGILNGLFNVMTYPWHRFFYYLQFQVFNLQTAARSWEVAEKHYNLGNELFSSFLDSSMNYSCGYWKDAKNLEEAQQHKMELIGKKLKLRPGMRVLDIGCGWGGLCKYLAQKYNVQVVGITVSKEGAKLAQERCKGLPVEIRVQDYRDLDEKFDRIVSVGMFEHVGRQNYRTFFEISSRCMRNDGIFLLHTIGHDNDFVPPIDPWVNTYIFPNGIIPNHKDIPTNIDNLFTIEDWHNFGQDYDKTLMAWHTNFVKNWPTVSHLFEDPKTFYRMWTYYLQLGAGLFRARKFHTWQVILTKGGMPGGYLSVR